MNANPDNLAAWVVPNGDGYSVVYAPATLPYEDVPRPVEGYQDVFARLADAVTAAMCEADVVRTHPDCFDESMTNLMNILGVTHE